MEPLFETAPGFDQPIAMLRHCHKRIRKQLGILRRLAEHLPQAGADVDAKQAASAVMRYFNSGAVNHHQDEENDLLPMLKDAAGDEDAVALQEILPGILQDHQQMDALWQALNCQLTGIAAGESTTLSGADVERFSAMYLAHMEREEAVITPMAERLLNDAQLEQLGSAMRCRRNIAD